MVLIAFYQINKCPMFLSLSIIDLASPKRVGRLMFPFLQRDVFEPINSRRNRVSFVLVVLRMLSMLRYAMVAVARDRVSREATLDNTFTCHTGNVRDTGEGSTIPTDWSIRRQR
jgi:hypothetical protein